MKIWSPDTALESLPPAAMWQRIAKSGCKYIAAGECDHLNWRSGAEVVSAIPVLSAANSRVLGVEWERRILQPAIDAYNTASAAQRQDGSDLNRLGFVFNLFPGLAARANPNVRDEFMRVNKGLAYAARIHKVNLQALNQLEEFATFVGHEPPAVQERFLRALVHLASDDPRPPALPPDEYKRFVGYMNNYMHMNLAHDKGRAASFISLVGKDRGLIFYGSAHFRGAQSNGIDAFLPQDKLVYVLIGQGEKLQDTLANAPGTRRAPEFVLDTANRLAWAMPRARALNLV